MIAPDAFAPDFLPAFGFITTDHAAVIFDAKKKVAHQQQGRFAWDIAFGFPGDLKLGGVSGRGVVGIDDFTALAGMNGQELAFGPTGREKNQAVTDDGPGAAGMTGAFLD